jgi:hypothetical protein
MDGAPRRRAGGRPPRRDPFRDHSEPAEAAPALPALVSAPAGAAAQPALPVVRLVPLRALSLEHQPRELVPEETLQQLVARGEATPAGLLAALDRLATVPGRWQEVRRRLDALAASIRAQGILQPVFVVQRGSRLVLRDGHRRCLAALLAGLSDVPAIVAEETSSVDALVRPLVLNVQREDLTAIEKARALLALYATCEAALRERLGWSRAAPAGGAFAVRAYDEPPEPGAAEPAPAPGAPDAGGVPTDTVVRAYDGRQGPRDDDLRQVRGERDLARLVRDWVLSLTGFGLEQYYHLMALNRLAPAAAAKAAEAGLTEFHLRPVVSLPPELHEPLVTVTITQALSARDVARLARQVRDQGEAALRRAQAAIGLAPASPRARTTWATLLRALPDDWAERVELLDRELALLPPRQRARRLQALQLQRDRALGLADALARIIARYEHDGDR